VTATPRRPVLVAVVLVAALVAGVALYLSRDDEPTTPLTIGWGGSEGHPSCVYEPSESSVDCRLIVTGSAPRPSTVKVTVTAYADENTSEPVGSTSRDLRVDGTMDTAIHLVIPVTGKPHVDEDGETACRLSVKY